jgi:ribokinase
LSQKICVIGSMNVDINLSIPRFHAPGETIMSTDYSECLGGKGGNQAVAASRLGCEVAMMGVVGNDANGNMYRLQLEKEGIDTSMISICNAATGLAVIERDTETGNNRIIVHSGANGQLCNADVDSRWETLKTYDCFLLQLETPLNTMMHIAQRLRQAGKTVILDPAPAQPLTPGFFASIDYITPNETELAVLTQQRCDRFEDILEAGKMLLRMGTKVIVKMGANGALLLTENGGIRVKGLQVTAVDTTAAGDSFNAGFAYGLANGMPEEKALLLANAVGALSTMGLGAQSAMPSLDRALQMMNHCLIERFVF